MSEKTTVLSTSDVSIEVIFDNYQYRKDLKASWGFSCAVRGAGKTILFDTGGDGAVLMDNMKKLKIDPKTIDAVVLSHAHKDHTGGLGAFLGQNADVEVYLPKSFSKEFKAKASRSGAKVIEVTDPHEICDGAWSTGEAGTDTVEESLVLRTDKGLIVITGCAHPGIVPIVEKAKGLFKGDDVLLAVGGFHLRGESEVGLRKTINSFRDLGVHRVGSGHCSGDRTRELFRNEYKKGYIEIGVGAVIGLD